MRPDFIQAKRVCSMRLRWRDWMMGLDCAFIMLDQEADFFFENYIV